MQLLLHQGQGWGWGDLWKGLWAQSKASVLGLVMWILHDPTCIAFSLPILAKAQEIDVSP